MHASQYEDQIDGNVVICPYCLTEYQPESEDYNEETRPEECEDCGKKFYLHQSFSVDHHTRPDCELNGEQHKFERVKFNERREADFCTVCDKCQSVSE